MPAYDRDEPLLPEPPEFLPFLRTMLVPPPGEEKDNPYLIYNTWQEVAAHGASIMDPVAGPDEAVSARARELSTGLESFRDRFEALARFVQGSRYVSIQLDLAKGGGMVPTAPGEVLRCNYGDCKDKANLLRALLAEVGIPSYAVIINSSGPREQVPVDWPSAGWFNHCIAAIAVPDDYQAEAVMEHPQLGRLLIFDPTDKYTPPGEISPGEYGGRYLVLSPLTDSLGELPDLAPQLNRVENRLEGTLTQDGNVTASLEHVAYGLEARMLRWKNALTSASDMEDYIRNRLTMDKSSITVSDLEVQVPEDTLQFRFKLKLEAPMHARSVGNQLLVFKPCIIRRRDWIPPTEERLNPIKIPSVSFSEIARIHLPENYEVDEELANASLEESFASYSCTQRVEEGCLVLERRLELREALLPREDYERVVSFYRQLVDVENTPVVLKRQ